jgi:hypothetical protein
MPPRIVSEIVNVAVTAFECHPRNPNIGDTDGILGSMEATGIFYGSLLVQKRTGYVLIGNHRLKAARMAGMAEVPVQYVDCDDVRAMEILIGDNQWSHRARWDDAALLAELDALPSIDEAVLGFSTLDVELLRKAVVEPGEEGGGGAGEGGGRAPTAEVRVQVGDVSFEISRERYDRWRGEATSEVGHANDALAELIAERLMI